MSDICNPVWQKGTYSLSNCVTLCANSSKKLKGVSLKFLQASLLCCRSLVCKMHWHRPFRKKVVSSQNQKIGKDISPVLSDRVLWDLSIVPIHCCAPHLVWKLLIYCCCWSVDGNCMYSSRRWSIIAWQVPCTISQTVNCLAQKQMTDSSIFSTQC